MTLSLAGKLVLHYVGAYGRHSELYVNDELIVAGFNCNKSIMLLLWCVCDSQYQNIVDYIYADFNYEETELGPWLCKVIFKPQLYSKYDILMTPNASAHAYNDMVYKKKLTINQALSARRDLIMYIQKNYKLDTLEIIYELDENEIFTSSRI